MSLTRRQEEMAELVMQGLSNKQIARELGVSPITVRETLHKAFKKLSIRNRTQLAMWANARICLPPRV